jgi:hypothetical protein
MDGLREMLREHEDTIVERWFRDTLAVYPGGAAAAFGRERDQFANPVGHSLRRGTRAVFDALLEDGETDALGRALDDILSIRAVQQMPAGQAVGFLFHLKAVIREVLDGATADPAVAAQITGLDHRIDVAALKAFETYVAYRELVCELRINEIKRTVPWRERTVRHR